MWPYTVNEMAFINSGVGTNPTKEKKMKGLITLVLLILSIGVAIGATATWTYINFRGGVVYRAR